MKTKLTPYWIFVSFIFVAACGESEQTIESSPSPSLQAEVFIVNPSTFNSQIMTTANLLASEQVELRAPISGQVLSVQFKEGSKVTKGQSILQMDDRVWKAKLIGLNAQLDFASSDYERKKDLLNVGGSSQLEIDQAYTTVENLKSEIQQLKVNIDLATVNAPFSGMIGMRNISNGAYLNAGDLITILTETGKMKVDFTLASQYQNSLKIGNVVHVIVDGDTAAAEIYAINPLVNSETRTINVRALYIPRADQFIMPGTFAEVIVATDFSDDALLIPSQAVVPEINAQTVYVYRNGRAEKHTVTIGARTADRVHVLTGIEPGDTIITTGLLQVKEGMNIELQTINQ